MIGTYPETLTINEDVTVGGRMRAHGEPGDGQDWLGIEIKRESAYVYAVRAFNASTNFELSRFLIYGDALIAAEDHCEWFGQAQPPE